MGAAEEGRYVSLLKPLIPACIGLAALLAPVTSAQATVSSATSLSTDIRIPSMGGMVDGQANVSATYASTQVTFTAVSTDISLAPGKRFLLTTCLQVHNYGSSPAASCAPRTVDTSGQTATVKAIAPTVTKTIARPAAGGGGYADATVTIDSLDAAGKATSLGTSWPAPGLPAAALPVFAQGAANGALPARQGTAMNNGLTGGVNTGYPDSMCVGVNNPTVPAPATGVSTTALGTMPDYYEVGDPSGAYVGQPAKGVMLVIHGGGWFKYGPGEVGALRGEADRWRARGWRTVNFTYHPCADALGSALGFYAQVRAKYGASIPVCALGSSAGGQLALELAAFRKGVACVVDESGPTDALSIAGQTAAPDATGSQTDGPRWVRNLMIAAFGDESLLWYSPAKLAPYLTGNGVRVLSAGSASDPWVPSAQFPELTSALKASNSGAYAVDTLLAAGGIMFVHGGVTQAALDDFHQRELALVAPLVTG